jgi:hypothetical protein
LGLVIIVVQLCACRCPTEFLTIRTGSPLLDGFSSYSSPASVSTLNLSERQAILIEEVACDRAVDSPCFEVQVFKTEFDHLGKHGELRLTFFNGRLYATTFYPDDLSTYLTELNKNGLGLPMHSEPLELSRNTLIWAATDEAGRGYVAWVDRRLREEHERWLSCYSS